MPYYKRRPKSYYIKRSIVRWLFWSSASLAAVFALSAIATRDAQPPCPISLQPDFTYISKEAFSLDECDLPYNISINDNGRWWWTQ
jgi:hypothetical protein